MIPAVLMPRSLSTPQAAAGIGCSYRQIYYWIQQGWLVPAGAQNGPGSRVVWGEPDLRAAALLRSFYETAPHAQVAARSEIAWLAYQNTSGFVLVLGEEVRLVAEAEEIVDCFRRGASGLVALSLYAAQAAAREALYG